MTIYLHKERAQIITLTMKRMRCEPAGGLAFWCLWTMLTGSWGTCCMHHQCWKSAVHHAPFYLSSLHVKKSLLCQLCWYSLCCVAWGMTPQCSDCSGMLDTVIEDNDTIVFISTLHGGWWWGTSIMWITSAHILQVWLGCKACLDSAVPVDCWWAS